MNTQIYEEASNWIVKNREGDLGTQEKRRFDDWLRESPQHVRAYLEVSSIWEGVSSLDPTWNPNADELIARAHAKESVIQYPRLSAPRASLTRVTRRGVSYALAASVLLLTLGAWFYSERNTYSTSVGEQRSIVLSDGSTIELNSRSRVRVRFSDAERGVDLLNGQALFEVAKNSARPFVVHSDATLVKAVGTQFDVYRKPAGTMVTVVEGRVAVMPEFEPSHETGGSTSAQERGSTQPTSVLVSAGEQLLVTQTTVSPPKRANVAAATAWTRRSLLFDSSSLTEVAEEFNRYNSRPLVVENPTALADFHVSGVFSSVEPALLVRFLRTQPEIVVEETDKEIRISKK